MQLAPLLEAVPPIPSHALVALGAIVIGAIQLLRPKGTRTHKTIGWMWTVIMAYVAISGLFIHELRMFGLFSPIHLLSVAVLVTLAGSITAIRLGNVRVHRLSMTILFYSALVINLVFTLWPGRVMHQVLFS